MKIGDLVMSTRTPGLGLGLVTCVAHAQPHGGYVWVAFEGRVENDTWCEVESLELISEAITVKAGSPQVVSA